jgi:DNA-binding NarL/FixJ family response regulator
MALHCLIVDDSAAFLEAARTLLEQEGVSVVGTASTGDDALRQARDLRPDVTLVDIDLGGDSGFGLAERLLAESGVDARGLILISTHAEDEFADLIAASPAAGFLSKSDLSAKAIREIVDGRRAPSDLR